MKPRIPTLAAFAVGASLITAMSWFALDNQTAAVEVQQVMTSAPSKAEPVLLPVPKPEKSPQPEVPAGAMPMEQAELIIKASLNIPGDLQRNSAWFNQDAYAGDTWTFSWNSGNKDDSFSFNSINVSVDARTGSIRHFNKWWPSDGQGRQPVITEDEALNKAKEFIERLQPEEAKQAVRNEAMKVQFDLPADIPLEKAMYVPFNFRFDRAVNGVIYPGNGFSVGINRLNGEVMEYDFNWHAGEMPAPEAVLDHQKAKEALLAGMNFNLSYMQRWGKEGPSTHLVYMPVRGFSGIVDAKSGQLLNYDGEAFPAGDGQYAPVLIPEVTANPVFNLENIPQLQAGANGISLSQAAAAAEGMMGDEPNLSSFNLYLERNYPDRQPTYWSVNWNSEVRQAESFAYRNFFLRLNAKTGQVEQIGFNGSADEEQAYKMKEMYADGEQPEIQEPQVLPAEAQAKAIAYLAALQPDLLAQTAIDNMEQSSRYPGKFPAPSYYFRFVRIVNGALYPNDSFWATVDGTTGNVVNYGMTWDVAGLTEVQPAITLDQAKEKLAETLEMELIYQRFFGWDKENNKEALSPVALVYRVKNLSQPVIDALSGEWLKEF